MARHIKYKGGYKYQLVSDYTEQVAILPSNNVQDSFLSLSTNGHLTIRSGYAWDGPSGPTIDTKNFMRGSLVHDALYQLMRLGLISASHREAADLELRRICREDGMSAIRARWVLEGLRWGGKKAANTRSRKKVLTAP